MYSIKKETLTGIADAVRAMTGGTDPIAVTDIATKILSIEGGGGSGGAVCCVTFMSHDGTTELYKKAVLVGDNCMNPVEMGWLETPMKDPTNTIAYTFAGWSTTAGGEADASALAKVTEDRVVYAAYTESTRLYTVRFFDGDTLLNTMRVEYGATADYTATKDGAEFGGWQPSNTNITADTDCYAQWVENPTFANSTWAKISEVCEAGEAATYFAVNDERTITTEAYGDIVLRIIGINLDNKADGSGKAGITVAVTKPNRVAVYSGSFHSSNGSDWNDLSSKCNYRTWCEAFLMKLPIELSAVIKTVRKQTAIGSWSTKETDDTVFPLSLKEVGVNVGSASDYEQSFEGAYPGFTSSNDKLLYNSSGTVQEWWTRTSVLWGKGYTYYKNNPYYKQYDKNSSHSYYPAFCI